MAWAVKLEDLTTDVRNALLDVVVDYTFAFDRLDDYDYQRLTISESSTEEKYHAMAETQTLSLPLTLLRTVAVEY